MACGNYKLDYNERRGADRVTMPGWANLLQKSFYLRQQFIFHRLSYRVQSARTKENEKDEKAPGLVVSSLAPVANNVHATDHLTDGEETKDLGSGNTNQSELLRAGVAGTGQEVLGRGEVKALDGGRVAGDIDQGLEVGLESGQGAGRKVVRLWEANSKFMVEGFHTEESCSGHGKSACQAQGRRGSSRESGGS